MAKAQDKKPGQVASGFNFTARDLDMAIMNACFSGMENYLIGRARFASWTFRLIDHAKGKPLPPPTPFRLDLATLAFKIGSSLDSLRAVFKGLVAKGVFIADTTSEGFYLFGKDYRSWVDPKTGKKLLDDSLADESDAMADRNRVQSNIIGWASLVLESDNSAPSKPRKISEKPRKISVLMSRRI